MAVGSLCMWMYLQPAGLTLCGSYQPFLSFCSHRDELLWGAAWLHKATRNPKYLGYIQPNGLSLGVDELDNTAGWDNKHVGAQVLLSKGKNPLEGHCGIT